MKSQKFHGIKQLCVLYKLSLSQHDLALSKHALSAKKKKILCYSTRFQIQSVPLKSIPILVEHLLKKICCFLYLLNFCYSFFLIIEVEFQHKKEKAKQPETSNKRYS